MICVILGVIIIYTDEDFAFSYFITKLTHKEYSNFYEEHYIIQDSFPLQDSIKKPNNLIIIFAESMESTFSANNIPMNVNGGGQHEYNERFHITSNEDSIFSPFGELIPNLTQIALKHTNFSDTNVLGGIMQTNGTGYTIAGIVGYMCGIPLNMPIYTFNQNIVLNSATCISDILHKKGYNQVMILGSNNIFQGKHYFLISHNIIDKDVGYYKNIGKLPIDYEVNWGFEDSTLFTFAKEELIELSATSEPFALYLLTTDTHFQMPHEFVDINICPDLENNARNSFTCSDRIIGEFVSWLQQQDFYHNTTIVILGDHLSMRMFDANSHRRIYNAFINPHFSITPTKELTHNRILSHFDITTLILDSIGFRVEEFGLGRNPLTNKTLLEINDLNEFNRLITQDSKVYEGFWRIDNK